MVSSCCLRIPSDPFLTVSGLVSRDENSNGFSGSTFIRHRPARRAAAAVVLGDLAERKAQFTPKLLR